MEGQPVTLADVAAAIVIGLALGLLASLGL